MHHSIEQKSECRVNLVAPPVVTGECHHGDGSHLLQAQRNEKISDHQAMAHPRSVWREGTYMFVFTEWCNPAHCHFLLRNTRLRQYNRRHLVVGKRSSTSTAGSRQPGVVIRWFRQSHRSRFELCACARLKPLPCSG